MIWAPFSMASASELATCTSDLAAAADALAAQLRRQDEARGTSNSSSNAPESLDPAEDLGHIYGAQRALLAAVNRVQAMLRQPSDFLRGLALHVRAYSSSSSFSLSAPAQPPASLRAARVQLPSNTVHTLQVQ